MERRFVFCGCQYPTNSGPASGKKSGWEWDIPTPSRKSKRISQSNPIFPTLRTLDDMEKLNKRYSDNLYEPVNPPPLYGSGYNMRFAQDTASLDGRVIDIPPEIDIITSDGLDGLDQPDFHDIGFDGEKEWCHSDDDHGQSAPKTGFTAGIRNRELPKSGETSSVRPLTGKNITFAPDVEQMAKDQTVPEGEAASKPSALEQLKQKAGQMKQRFSKISLPVRPKFNNWAGMKLSRKKRKKADDDAQDAEEQDIVLDSQTRESDIASPPKSGRRDPLAIPADFCEPSTSQSAILQITASAKGGDDTFKKDTKELEQSKPTERTVQTKEEEALRLAVEKEEAKIAKEVEAARIAREKEAAKLLKEEEKSRTVKEKQLAKHAKAEEAARIAKEKENAKLAKEAEAARITQAKLTPVMSPKVEEIKKEVPKTPIESELKQKSAQAEDKKWLELESKLAKDVAEEELQRQKEDEKLNKDKTQEEQKRIKADEKATKDKIKEEQKKERLEQKHLTDELKKARIVEELKLEIEQANLAKAEVGISPEEDLERRLAAIVDEFEQDLGPSMNEPKDKSVSPVPKKPSAGEVIKRKLADIDFTKRFKRSKTPPPRPEPPKLRFTKRGVQDVEPQNRLAAQYAAEIKRRDADLDAERLHEPQIYVTQPSVEADSETHAEWTPHADRSSPSQWQVEEQNLEDEDEERPKLKKKLKGIGQGFGKKMKVIGHDLKQFGGKVNVKYKETIKEIKDTQERKRIREARDAEMEDQDKPTRRFRFRRRGNDDQEIEAQRYQPVVVETVKKSKKKVPKPTSTFYENNEEVRMQIQQGQQSGTTGKVQRSQVLGRGDRDWESPLDFTQSREESEEPNFSGNMSSGRNSPPGSSLASSHQGRRQGVMEEIDSDEFFLRERGISEGEDEEVLNRILVEELRQTFRPTMSNALNDFDLPTPPAKPTRSPRKPPRKEKGKIDKKSSNFQTFPPERPKRKQTPGYISSYLENERNEGTWNPDDKITTSGTIEQENFNESEEEEDEGIRRVKNELRKIDQDMEDEGRYEPVSDSPQRPQRGKRKKQKSPEPPQILYYNTIAGNEWLKDLEDQINNDMDLTLTENAPIPPNRERRKSEGKSETQSQLRGTSEIDDSELQFADEEDERPKQAGYGEAPPLAQAESVGQMDDGDSLDYMDEAGYTVVQKNKDNSPKTVPRRRKGSAGNGNSSKRNSLKRRSQEGRQAGSGPIFFSLPRYTPRTFHIVPPTRPHRTYSALRPKRPPRQKSMSNQHLEKKSTNSIKRSAESPASPLRGEDSERPNTAIGIMQGRPLPPPPRPARSPAPLNDLDQVSLERIVGVRQYANFDSQIDANYPPVVEEVCVATNISMLGRDDEDGSLVANSDINVAIQTDPIPDEDFELNTLGSFEEEDSRIDKNRYSLPRTSLEDQRPLPRVDERHTAVSAPSYSQHRRSRSPAQTEVIFPSRLHLEELEVDFLRVNELTAHSLTMDHLHSPYLQVNSLSSSGPLSVSSIQSMSITTENINSERIASNALDAPVSVPPPQFYQLADPSHPTSRREKIDDEECEEEPCDEATTTQQEDVSCPRLVLSGIQGARQIQRSVPASPATPLASPHITPHDAESDDIIDLGVRLGRSLFRLTMRALEAITDYIDVATSSDPECQQQQRAHMQALICLLLILVAGIFLMTRSGSSQPRWEFYLPPPVEQ